MPEDAGTPPLAYSSDASPPATVFGRCRNCVVQLTLDLSLPYNDNSESECGACGTKTTRLESVREALRQIDPIVWSFLSADYVVFDSPTIAVGSYVTYNVTETMAKWINHQVTATDPHLTPFLVPVDDGSSTSIYVGLNAPAVPPPGNLHKKWDKRVNQRRNHVVHRANVHVTTDEARDSLGVVLDAIDFLDPLALVRPHVYYTGPQAT